MGRAGRACSLHKTHLLQVNVIYTAAGALWPTEPLSGSAQRIFKRCWVLWGIYSVVFVCSPAVYHIQLACRCHWGGEWVTRGPATSGWSDTERLNMVQPRTLSKGLAVKKISYVGCMSSHNQKIDNTGAVRHKTVPGLNFMVDHPIVKTSHNNSCFRWIYWQLIKALARQEV